MRCVLQILFAVGVLFSRSAGAVPVTLEWTAIPEAAQYEVEIYSKGKAVKSFTVPANQTKYVLNLPPATYEYQLRSVDFVKAKSPWSPKESFTVTPPAPKLLSPVDGISVALPFVGAPIRLEWADASEAKGYEVVIEQNGRTIYQKLASSRSALVPGLKAGPHRWRVTPATVQSTANQKAGSYLLGNKSSWSSFSVRFGKLDTPRAVFPLGTQASPDDSKLVLEWKSVAGAAAYLVRMYELKANGRGPASVGKELGNAIVTKNQWPAPNPGRGKYRWQVRALATVNPGDLPESASELVNGDFELTVSSKKQAEQAAIQLSVGYEAAQYQLDSGYYQLRGSGSLPVTSVGAAAKFPISPRMAATAAFGLGMMSPSTALLTEISGSAGANYRLPLDSTTELFLEAGLASRQNAIVILNNSGGNVSPTLGARVADFSGYAELGAERYFRERLKGGISFGIRNPFFLLVAPKGSKLDSGIGLSNWRAAINGEFAMTGTLSIGAVLSWENRQLNFTLPAANSGDVLRRSGFGTLVFLRYSLL